MHSAAYRLEAVLVIVLLLLLLLLLLLFLLLLLLVLLLGLRQVLAVVGHFRLFSFPV